MKLVIAKPFKDIFQFKKKLIALNSGRIGGKSFVIGDLALYLVHTRKEQDVVLCRNSYSDLEKSIYSQVTASINRQGMTHLFQFKKEPLRIIHDNGNIIYFEGIGGSDKSRTRSFVPKHTLSMIGYDELQQVKDEESLLQSNASFRRYLDRENGLILHAYNPPSQNSHWINIAWKRWQQDPDWLCIRSSYKDIAQYLNEMDLKDILKMKYYDYDKYLWFYMGEAGGGFGSVYPQFKREKHFRPAMQLFEEFGLSKGSQVSDEVKRIRFSQRIDSIIIGGDGAVNRDATTFQPFALMADGHMIRLEQFYYNPQQYGQKSSYELIPAITRWIEYLNRQYRLIANEIPVIFAIDSAATELTRMVKINLDERFYQVYSYGKQTIIDMTGVMQSSLASNAILIADFGGYMEWTTNTFIKEEDPLVIALENLVWNDKQTGYDPSVPNDTSDAATYAINFVKRNPQNIYAISMYNNNRQEYYD